VVALREGRQDLTDCGLGGCPPRRTMTLASPIFAIVRYVPAGCAAADV
jgi:hypothetical protein